MHPPTLECAPAAKMPKSVPTSGKESSKEASIKDVPFSLVELNALLEAMRRASCLIHGSNQPTAQLGKAFWIQITDHLHTYGSQHRRWQQVRDKGQELMKRVFEERMKMGRVTGVSPTNDKLHPKPKHPGAPAKSDNGQSPQLTVSEAKLINLPDLTPAPNVFFNPVYQNFSSERRPDFRSPVVASSFSVNPCTNSTEFEGTGGEVTESQQVPLQVLPDPSCVNMPIRSLGQLISDMGQENPVPLPNYLLGNPPIDLSTIPAIPVCDPGSFSTASFPGSVNKPNGSFEHLTYHR